MTSTCRLAGFGKFVPVVVAAAALFGCGGGGGGGGGSGGSGTGFSLSQSSVTFQALATDPAPETINVQASWTSSAVAVIAVGVPPGQSLPSWLDLRLPGVFSNPLTIEFRRVVNGNAPGTYSATVRVVTGDVNSNVLDIVDVPVSFEVVAVPTITPNPLNLTWVESEQPSSQQLTITRDNRVQVAGTIVDVNWLGVAAAGDTLTVSGNAQSQSQAPGPLSGNLTATFSFNGRQRNVVVPIAATVGRALNGPAQIAREVNASTVAADLANIGATVATATQAALTFSAASNVPWLTVTGGTTGSPNNLTLTLVSGQLDLMANGTHPATITLTAPNVSALQIPVVLTLRLPEVHFVAPVAFSDTVATDYVIARGAGLNDPGAAVQLAGVAVGGVTTVNDTEIRFVPGARAAGTYEVKVLNGLNLNRATANLRVTDPPAYANFSMDAPVGPQERIVSSPINAAVFSQMCHFCQINPTGTPSTVQRFAYDSGSGNWTRTQHAYAQLYDIALSPDESSLIVLTATQLLLVDPATMATTKTVNLPATLAAQSRQLAVMNSGLVIIQALGQAYSLRADAFVPVSGLISDGGIGASRDGSRAIFGEPTNSGTVAYRYYDASTGSIVISTTFDHYARGTYDRHAQKAFVNSLLVNASLASIGTLAISSHSGDLRPDGSRAYGMDFSTNPYRVRLFDVSGAAPFTELTPLTVTGMNTGIARLAADPRGNTIFVVGEGKFVVFAVP